MAAVGQRRLAVLAPRRRHLAVRVLTIWVHPVSRSPRRWPARAGSVRGDVGAGARRPVHAARRRTGTAASDADRPIELGAQLYAAQCASCHGVDGTGRRGPRPDARRPRAGGGRLRPAHRADADGRPRHAGRARAGPVHRGGDRRPRRLRRRVRRRPRHPRRRHRRAATSPTAASCTASTARRATSRPARAPPIGGGREAPDADGRHADRRSARRSSIGPGAMPVFGSFTPEDIDDVATYIDDLQRRAHRRRSTTSAAPDRSPRGSPRGCSRLLPLIALTRWIGRPHEGRDAAGRPTTADRPRCATERRRCTRGAAVNQRAYRAAVVSFVVAIAGGIVAAIGYGTDNTGDLLGLGLAAALGGIGFGLVVAGPSTSTSTSTPCSSASRCVTTAAERRTTARGDRR